LDEKYPEKFFNTTIVGQALQFDQICLKENQQTLINFVKLLMRIKTFVLLNYKKMKNHKLVTVLLLVFIPFVLLAHPPKKVNVKYKKESKILIISIPHGVKDVTKHYIKSITISVNGNEIKVLEYKSQTSEASHDVEIELPELKNGDKVKVKVKCNKMGAKKTIIKI